MSRINDKEVTDLPEPDSPTMPRTSPVSSFRLIPSTATFAPNAFVTSGYIAAGSATYSSDSRIVSLTGGGFWENIPRVLPDNTQAVIDESSWQWPEVFNWLQTAGNVSSHEMYRTFNCGVGMVIALPAEAADKAIAFLNDKGENAWKIGYIKASDSEQRVVIE